MTDARDLESLTEAGHKVFALKDYDTAAVKYALASEESAKLYGESDVRNADILFHYGRALYSCAVKKSDVLGDGAAPAEQSKDVISDAALAKSPQKKRTLFQFQGDEDDDEAEGADENGTAENEEEGEDENVEEDDFTVAWEVLDLARVLFEKRIEAGGEHRKDQERLAEVFDILGEVSLESENFPQAVQDLKSSLNLKLTLFEKESTIISEAHFKLALAYEFSGEEQAIDKAAEEIQQAINSCQLRITKEETSVDDKGKQQEDVDVSDARQLVVELQQRLKELKTPSKPQDPLQDILGESAEDVKKRLASVMTGANDVSSLVRKKTKKETDSEVPIVAEHAENGQPPSKKVRVEPVDDTGV